MSEAYDIVVIGTGIAGLATALAAAPRRVALVTRGEFSRDGASRWAQGGVAAALGADDAISLHVQDTLAAGQYLNDQAAVNRLAAAAPDAIHWLQSLGARFDERQDGKFVLGREAAHSRARIVHAGGDASGAEIMRALGEAARAASHIDVFEQTFASELLTIRGQVCAVALRGMQGDFHISARVVVLATGGIGALYRYTTNPESADGAGLSLAMRAGAVLADMEFMQFHPTALAPLTGQHGQLPLLTEALRGAGATLTDANGRRFMFAHSSAAELAPRDVVARAVWAEQAQGRDVFLDARSAIGSAFPQRFPTVFAACMAREIDPRSERIPVVPAAHYLMGGIRVDAKARSSVPGLYAVGECACSGVHGANRLASNSLLEGLVFGRELGNQLAEDVAEISRPGGVPIPSRNLMPVSATLATAVADLLWRYAGLVRSRSGLIKAREALTELAQQCAPDSLAHDRVGLASVIVEAALARRESIGAHFRSDAAGQSTVAAR